MVSLLYTQCYYLLLFFLKKKHTNLPQPIKGITESLQPIETKETFCELNTTNELKRNVG